MFDFTEPKAQNGDSIGSVVVLDGAFSFAGAEDFLHVNAGRLHDGPDLVF